VQVNVDGNKCRPGIESGNYRTCRKTGYSETPTLWK
jgi:hypothetical protein